MSANILLIDNYDSFIYNLKYELEMQGAKVKVCRNDINYEDLKALALESDGVVVSPGPGAPKEAGHCIRLIQDLQKDKPMLGICLGHQAMIEAFGGKVAKAQRAMHGKTSAITTTQQGMFASLKSSMQIARYHSLSAHEVPEGFNVTAKTRDNEVMAICHKELPIQGLQFHPESIMSMQGSAILGNFLKQLSTKNKNNTEQENAV